MLEGLCLLSQSQSSRNRPAVARSTVVDVLWSLVLPWDGEYEDGHGGIVKLETVDVEKGAVLIKRWQKLDVEEGSASSMASEKEVEALGVIFQGTVLEVVLNQQEGRKLGSFTGKQILFADAQSTVWTRRRCPSSAPNGKGRDCEGSAPAAAREVLRLVLTQLLLSLRWEPTHLGLGPSTASTGALAAGFTSALLVEPLSPSQIHFMPPGSSDGFDGEPRWPSMHRSGPFSASSCAMPPGPRT